MIVCANELHNKNINNLEKINTIMLNTLGVTCVNYCLITSTDCVLACDSKILFKYKTVNSKHQLDKICDFITEYRSELNYDWYVKIRPDLELCKPLDFNSMCDDAINARARQYIGPRQVLCGASVNLGNHPDCYYYSDVEEKCVLDDMIYIFHNNVIHLNAFNKLQPQYKNLIQHEWGHFKVWNDRNIKKNIITIYARMRKGTRLFNSCNIPPSGLRDDIPP